jgi:hypothetical protein
MLLIAVICFEFGLAGWLACWLPGWRKAVGGSTSLSFEACWLAGLLAGCRVGWKSGGDQNLDPLGLTGWLACLLAGGLAESYDWVEQMPFSWLAGLLVCWETGWEM